MNITDYLNSLYEDDKDLDKAIDDEKKRRGIQEGWFANYKAKKQQKRQDQSNKRQTKDINNRLNKLQTQQNTLDNEKKRRSQMKKATGPNIGLGGVEGKFKYNAVNSNTDKQRNKELLKKPRDKEALDYNQDRIDKLRSFYNKAKDHINQTSNKVAQNEDISIIKDTSPKRKQSFLNRMNTAAKNVYRVNNKIRDKVNDRIEQGFNKVKKKMQNPKVTNYFKNKNPGLSKYLDNRTKELQAKRDATQAKYDKEYKQRRAMNKTSKRSPIE